MSREVVVAVGMDLPDEAVRAIEAVGPGVGVRLVPELAGWGRPLSPEAAVRVREALAGAEVLFAWGFVRREMLAGADRLTWLHVAGAGLDGFRESGGLEMGLTVTNSRGVAAEPIAEWVTAAVLSWAKGLHIAVRNQLGDRRTRWQATTVAGKTAGIIGLGAIGEATARRLKALGMRVVATRRTAKPGSGAPDCDLLLPQAELSRLLAESDYVVVAAPLTPETEGLIGAEELRQMRDSAVVINIARGAIVSTDALVAALRDGTIGGAVLDVTHPEPLPRDHPLWDLPNAIIAPHNSAGDDQADARMLALFHRQLQSYLAGQPLENLVDPKLGY